MSKDISYLELIFSVTIIVWLSSLSEKLGNIEFVGWILMLLMVLMFVMFIQNLNQHLEYLSQSPLQLSVKLSDSLKWANVYWKWGFSFLLCFPLLGLEMLHSNELQNFLSNSAVVVSAWIIMLIFIPTIRQ